MAASYSMSFQYNLVLYQRDELPITENG